MNFSLNSKFVQNESFPDRQDPRGSNQPNAATVACYLVAIVLFVLTLAMLFFPQNAKAATLNDTLVAQAQAGCPVVKSAVPAIGCTADKKYVVFAVKGGVGADFWVINGKKYKSDYVIDNLPAIAASDVGKNGIHCHVTCQDGLGNTIGMNPGMIALKRPVKK